MIRITGVCNRKETHLERVYHPPAEPAVEVVAGPPAPGHSTMEPVYTFQFEQDPVQSSEDGAVSAMLAQPYSQILLTVTRAEYQTMEPGQSVSIVVAPREGREELLARLSDLLKRVNVEDAEQLLALLERRLA